MIAPKIMTVKMVWISSLRKNLWRNSKGINNLNVFECAPQLFKKKKLRLSPIYEKEFYNGRSEQVNVSSKPIALSTKSTKKIRC